MTESILTDGVIHLHPSTPENAPLIIAGRDTEFRRFIGQGSAVPAPKYVIVVGGCAVGWVDHDRDDDRWWLAPGRSEHRVSRVSGRPGPLIRNPSGRPHDRASAGRHRLRDSDAPHPPRQRRLAHGCRLQRLRARHRRRSTHILETTDSRGQLSRRSNARTDVSCPIPPGRRRRNALSGNRSTAI